MRRRPARLPQRKPRRLGIGEGQAGDEADVDVGEAGEESALPRPVDESAAGAIARADDEVVARAEIDQLREVAGIVGVVGVHLDDEIVALARACAKPSR